MPKATAITKKKGRSQESGRKRKHLIPTNARDAALERWVSAIAAGETMRSAASPLLAEHGFTWGMLRGWCDADPDGWGQRLEAAQAAKIERVERELRRIATGEIEDPAIARAQTAAATWLLSKWKRDEYGDKQTTELTGKDGGPVQTQAEVVRYQLRVPVNPLVKVPPPKATDDDDE